ncbi:MAG: hypothetical protein RM338_00835 [Nostoc sp. DedQUE12a]|nr:hypothetical protein [Nostoc sp. DedQUE12a]
MRVSQKEQRRDLKKQISLFCLRCSSFRVGVSVLRAPCSNFRVGVSVLRAPCSNFFLENSYEYQMGGGICKSDRN